MTYKNDSRELDFWLSRKRERSLGSNDRYSKQIAAKSEILVIMVDRYKKPQKK
jgi:hypothetical protein